MYECIRLLLFLHVRFVNQHTRTGVALFHQKFGHTGINGWKNLIYPSAEVSRADQSYRSMNYCLMLPVKLINRDRSCEISQRLFFQTDVHTVINAKLISVEVS